MWRLAGAAAVAFGRANEASAARQLPAALGAAAHPQLAPLAPVRGVHEDTGPGGRKPDEAPASSQDVDFGFSRVSRADHKDMVKQVFESVAPSYDNMNDLMSFFQHRLWKDEMVRRLHPFAGQRHIDVAGGTGDIAFRVLREIERQEQLAARTSHTEVEDKGSVYVCDINGAMLDEGRRRAPGKVGEAAAGRLEWVETDAESLPFERESFDSYSISFGIRNVSSIEAALREAHRVLRPGGHFCCLEFSRVATPALREVYDLYSMNVIPSIGGAYAGDAQSYQYLVESIRQFPDQEAFKDIIASCGFRHVRYDNLFDGVVAIHSGFKL